MRLGFCIVLLAVYVFSAERSWAESTSSSIMLEEVQKDVGLFLGRRVSVWENTQAPADPNSIFSMAEDSNFEISKKDYPGPAFFSGELWVRISLYNSGTEMRSFVLESRYPLTDWISVFQKDKNNQVQEEERGDRSKREFELQNFRAPSFYLTVFPGKNTYYLRITSKGSNILSLFLWDAESFKSHRFLDTLIIGCLFGILFSLFLYNSFLAVAFRSRTYAYYSLFLFSMIVLHITMQNLWPYLFKSRYSSWLENEAYVVFGILSNSLYLIVTMTFLNMKKSLPRTQIYFRMILIASISELALLPFIAFNVQSRLVTISVFVGALSVFIACFMAVLEGYRPAKYYMIASLAFLVSNILLALNLLGVHHEPLVTQYGNFFGVAIEGLLMSLAIADRVNFIRTNSDRVIKELNAELQAHLVKVEAIVAERTETIRNILDNVASGFLIVDRNEKIMEGFSRSCHQILGQQVQEGKAISELLQLSESLRKIWHQAFGQIFNDELPEEVSLDQLPSAIRLGQRSLKLEAKALRGNDGHIVNILFTIQDITELKRRQRESQRNKTLIKILRDLEAFRQFINHSFEFVARLKVTSDKKEKAFLLHTLKGNSLVFGLNKVANHIHSLEEISQLKTKDIESIEQLFHNFLSKYESILKTPWANNALEARVTPKLFDDLRALIAVSSHDNVLLKVDSWIQHVTSLPVHTQMHPMLENCRTLAHKLHRSVDFELIGGDVRICSEQEEKIVGYLIHIIRNAIVHGIEADRPMLGKPKQGLIKVEFSESLESLTVVCSDDGQGFDRSYWEALALKSVKTAEKSELQQLPWLTLIEYASKDGHSSQAEVSLESGRGIGLTGIIQAVRQVGAELRIDSEKGRGSRFSVTVSRSKHLLDKKAS